MRYTCGRSDCPAPGCPHCYPPTRYWATPIAPPPITEPYVPAGCICPPTSEKTCESQVCPRKNHGTIRHVG
jgi:hypothetical protein